MDGLTFSVPLSENREEYEQISLFDSFEDFNKKLEPKYCKIKNWRSNIVIEYRSMMEERKYG